jgi:hypothetical protein
MRSNYFTIQFEYDEAAERISDPKSELSGARFEGKESVNQSIEKVDKNPSTRV